MDLKYFFLLKNTWEVTKGGHNWIEAIFVHSIFELSNLLAELLYTY